MLVMPSPPNTQFRYPCNLWTQEFQNLNNPLFNILNILLHGWWSVLPIILYKFMCVSISLCILEVVMISSTFARSIMLMWNFFPRGGIHHVEIECSEGIRWMVIGVISIKYNTLTSWTLVKIEEGKSQNLSNPHLTKAPNSLTSCQANNIERNIGLQLWPWLESMVKEEGRC